MRNRARRALLALLVLLPALAIAAPARADSSPTGTRPPRAPLAAPGTAVPPGAGQGAICGRAPGDGPRRRLRRGQRDRRRPRAVRLLARGRAVVLAGRRGRGCRAPHAAQRRAQRRGRVRSRSRDGDRGCLSDHAGEVPAGRPRRRHRNRSGRRDRDDRGTGRRRPLPARAVHVPDRDAAGPVAPDVGRQRPRRMAEGRQAVRAPGSGPVPRAEAACAPHEGLRRRLQRGEGDRAGDRLDADAAADGRGELLGPDQPRPRRSRACCDGRGHAGRHRRGPRADVREHVHEHRRRGDRDVA